MPRSRHVPVDHRPELTDEIVGLGFLPYDADKQDVRDMIAEVLKAMDVSFVDKTTLKRKPAAHDPRWERITPEVMQRMMAESMAMRGYALNGARKD